MEDLPKRKQIRLKDYDYSQNGYYFITICARNRKNIFSEIVCMSNDMVCADNIYAHYTKCGKWVEIAIQAVSAHYDDVFVDKYVIMPNHIHLILVFDRASIQTKNGRMISAPTVPVVIGQSKRWVSKQIGFSCWQKSYYEHIIRNEQEYLKISEYIQNNPLKWKEDKYYES